MNSFQSRASLYNLAQKDNQMKIDNVVIITISPRFVAGDGYRCGPCPESYEGDGTVAGCRRVVPNCADRPCFPGVACIDLVGGQGFKCGECPADYVGDGSRYGCRLVNCRDSPCFPGVSCSDTGGTVQ